MVPTDATEVTPRGGSPVPAAIGTATERARRCSTSGPPCRTRNAADKAAPYRRRRSPRKIVDEIYLIVAPGMPNRSSESRTGVGRVSRVSHDPAPSIVVGRRTSPEAVFDRVVWCQQFEPVVSPTQVRTPGKNSGETSIADCHFRTCMTIGSPAHLTSPIDAHRMGNDAADRTRILALGR
jgi:hypothetical protein